VNVPDRNQRLRELIAAAPPMDAAMRAAQRESFAYGNLKIEESRLSRDMVVSVIAKLSPKAR
jgi:hypothetical protein